MSKMFMMKKIPSIDDKCHMKKKIRKIDKRIKSHEIFHCLSYPCPFFYKKNILGLFFTATNTHIALSWSFPLCCHAHSICCPALLNNNKEYHAHTQKTQQKKEAK